MSKLLSFAFLLILLQFSSGQEYDGVIVTQSDFQALQSIKYEIIDPKGVLKSWNDTGLGACSWWIGIKCVNGQVIAIQLPWKSLGGRISDKIGRLLSLRKISLHDNALSGSVPLSLGFLPNLRGLYLFNNRFSGSIPMSLAQSTSLQAIDLSNNKLTGNINLGNSTGLYRLNLSYNGLSGSIPSSLTQISSLVFLSLHNNNLSGSVPDSWGGNGVYQLKTLTLDHNRLTGEIPSSLSKLNLLESLSLDYNLITGTIPDELGNLSKIQSLNLSNNNVSGEIPSSISKLLNLTSFNVSYNNLSGSVPSVLSKKFNSSSFVGNIQLCGYSSSTPCPSISPSPQIPPSPSVDGLKHDRDHRRRRLSTKDIILIASGAFLLVLLLLCCFLICCLVRRRVLSTKAKNLKKKSTSPVAGLGEKDIPAEVQQGGETGGKLVHFDGPFVFTADDLLCATAEIIGKSSYGTVYKATLEDGNQVAVKRLREKVAKGHKEFESEVSILGRIRHQNILALRSYYIGPKGEKLLVYDYMSNGSLASFLHARGPETIVTWTTRMKIAMGITRGLCFLHKTENIVHGNLTSSNIALDEENTPKIGDVALSRLMTAAANTNVIATAGTMGYRAPELSKIKNASTKTDIYSLGVIMLELLTGKSPAEATDGSDLPQWVASIVKEEWTNEVFDVEIMKEASECGDELLNTLKLALHCVDPSPVARPEAQQVLQQLEQIKPEMAAGSASTAAAAAISGDDEDDDEEGGV
ncbi:probably inactive leucine-rich repeat receptor-like protein kinase IMK2 [Impatiens glandulifera]|uniref:probably inactive leucine-rich repeat receptor-like protein kinase IMK2 n=1 Tax=Impatiens glandulifera TaxID=253017 RepID=UPI001FB13D3F|nr:probably inactive leucine-rich repeat receptor-like protein kinase IMK2 [Impatiens glandulifera]